LASPCPVNIVNVVNVARGIGEEEYASDPEKGKLQNELP
jgi:hypothetical protein